MELKRKIKFNSEVVKRQAILEVESGFTRYEVSEKYGISYSTLKNWLKLFGSKAYSIKKKNLTSNKQKRIIVRKITDGEMTVEEAYLSTGVKAPQTIRDWIKKFDKDGIDDLESNQPPMPISNVAALDLRKALNQANLKVLALETMIDVAEEQFKINIRKKAGAKQ